MCYYCLFQKRKCCLLPLVVGYIARNPQTRPFYKFGDLYRKCFSLIKSNLPIKLQRLPYIAFLVTCFFITFYEIEFRLLTLHEAQQV